MENPQANIFLFEILEGNSVKFHHPTTNICPIIDLFSPFLNKRVHFGLAILNKVDSSSRGLLGYDKHTTTIFLQDNSLNNIFHVSLKDYVGDMCCMYIVHEFDAKNKSVKQSMDVVSQIELLKSSLSSVLQKTKR